MTSETPERTIAFILYDGLTILDMVGPLQVLSGMAALHAGYRTVVVGERKDSVSTDTPLSVAPSATFAEVPAPYVLIVPGGGLPAIRAMGDPAVQAYVRQTAETAAYVGSVCTGALVLGAAGLLEGRQATTHWAYARLLEALGARYHRQRWVEDGKYITAAGVSAGIDMALHLAARLTDEATARRIQLGIEYDPQPPFGPISWDGVDPDQLWPRLVAQLPDALAGSPDLVRKLVAR